MSGSYTLNPQKVTTMSKHENIKVPQRGAPKKDAEEPKTYDGDAEPITPEEQAEADAARAAEEADDAATGCNAAPARINPIDDKDSELGSFIQQTAKVHGDNVIRSAELRPRFKHLPTHIFPLDVALHGGIPEGCISLIYGRAGSGKTTLAGRALASAQAKYPDSATVFIDVEGTYQPEWGEKHGVDNERMALIQPDTGEQALDLARGAVKSKEVSCVVVDSLAALTPMKELDKSMEDLTVGEQGKLIARFCRTIQSDMLTERKRGHRPAIILINQWRMKIGTMFGDPRTLPGGEAQHYAASLKLEMKNKEIMGKDRHGYPTVIHNEHGFKVDKSKIGVGIREGEFIMQRSPQHWGGSGFIDDAKAMIAWGRSRGTITGGGSSWRVAGVDSKFSRLQDIADYLYSDPEFYTLMKDEALREYREDCGLKPDYL